jgi:hypothetical protein
LVLVFYSLVPHEGSVNLVTQAQLERGIDRAAVRSMVILRLEVSLGARRVASSAVDAGAVGASLARLDGETVLGEAGVGAHIDAGHVPEDGVAGLGVLELQHVGLILGHGQLDGDAAAVVVALPRFLVVAAARREGMHVTDSIRHRPRVDGGIQVVDDVDAAAAVATSDGAGGGAVGGGVQVVGKGRGESGHEREGLEHHFGF